MTATHGRAAHLSVERANVAPYQFSIEFDVLSALSAHLRSVTVPAGSVSVVSVGPTVNPTTVAKDVVRHNTFMKRSDAIWDLYESEFGDEILSSCGEAKRAHHTQIRWVHTMGHDFAQIAIYPTPLRIAETRLWVDPATIVILAPSAKFDALVHHLGQIRPLWERLVAHHGPPLLAPMRPGLRESFPAPRHGLPISETSWRNLCQSVQFLSEDHAIDDVVEAVASPQRAVDRTLSARRDVDLHRARLIAVLDHTHGSIEEKYAAVQSAFAAQFPDEDAAIHQMAAPHRHLRDAMEETRRDVVSLADRAATTASLIASASIGRLLDKSEANRVAGTALAAALAIISLVTTFTTIAAIPADNRHLHPLVKLAAGIAVVFIVVSAAIVGLTKLSTRPPIAASRKARRLMVIGSASLVTGAGTCLSIALTNGSLILAIVGGALIVASLAVYAVMNDFR